jgi:hypothetical protein
MSYAIDVKGFYQIQQGKIFTWNDLVREMNLKLYIAEEEKTDPMQHNSPLKVRFTDGSDAYVDDPWGIRNAFLVTLPNQE